MVLDQFGRHIRYLRISLTDRCNLRCVYCMPEQMVFLPREELLTDDELIRLARLFAELGFDKIRLTGGEPTVRPHLVELVARMAALPGIREISMTTNGLRLKALAEPLARAGLKRVNVSLDTWTPRSSAASPAGADWRMCGKASSPPNPPGSPPSNSTPWWSGAITIRTSSTWPPSP